MKWTKRVTALVMGCTIAVGMTACGANNNQIVAENDTTKITMGSYAYMMSQAYYGAKEIAPDVTAPVLPQEIQGQSASEWMKNKTLETMKLIFVVDEKAKELGVTLSDAERKSIDDQMDNVWDVTQDSVKKLISYGVTKEGAKQLYLEFNTKYRKIFETMYSENGVKAVSYDEKKTYYTENYTDFAYIQKSFSGLTEEEKVAVKERMEGYVASINDQTKTADQVAEEHKTTEGLTSDPLSTTIANLSSSAYPADMVTALQEMNAGEARFVEVASSSSYMLVVKNDINAVADEKLKEEATDFQVLVDMKGEEYTAEIDELAKNYTNFTLHENVMNSFDVAVLEKEEETTSSASSSSVTASAS